MTAAAGFRVGPESHPDRYVLGRAVASGSEGLLYRGWITTTGGVRLDVAIKMLQPRLLPHMDEWQDRWSEQVELLRSLQVPAVVRVRDGFIGPLPHPPSEPGEGRSLYLVMNWVEGETLDEWVRHRPDSDGFDTLKLLIPVAAALDLMHSGRATGGVPVVHRDVKPSNIVITDEGGVLVDFGLTRGLPTGLRISGVSGTPGYVAPEALEEGVYTPASDRYALGAVAYFVLTGTEPPTTHQPGAMRAALAASAALQGRPEALDHIMAMLAADPARRPTALANWIGQLRRSSLAPLASALAPEALRRQPGSGPHQSAKEDQPADDPRGARPDEAFSAPRPRIGRWVLTGAVCIITVAVLAALVITVLDRRSAPSESSRSSLGAAPATSLPSPPTIAETIPATTAPARSLPRQGPIPADLYQPSLRPTMQLRLGEGWDFQPNVEVDASDSVYFVRDEDHRMALSVAHVTGMYRSDVVLDVVAAARPENVLPVPADMAAALRADRRLTVNSMTPVSVGGFPGVRLDVSASADTKSCAEPCVLLYPSVATGNRFVLYGTKKNSMYVVNVRGETLVISAEAPPDKFDALLPLVEAVVQSVRFP